LQALAHDIGTHPLTLVVKKSDWGYLKTGKGHNFEGCPYPKKGISGDYSFEEMQW